MVNWCTFSNPMNFQSRKLFSLIFLLAAIAGFGMALSRWGATPPAGDLAAVARNLGGLSGGGPWDAFLVTLWQWGGEAALSRGRWAVTFLLWTAVFAIAGFGCLRLARNGRFFVAGGIVAISALAVGVFVFDAIRNWQRDRLPVRLSVPSELFLRLPRDGMVFANPTAMFWAPLFAADRPGEFAPMESTEDPAAWRAAARKAGAGAAIFAGPVSAYLPVLEHLMASRDWRLEEVSNAGFLLLRDGAPDAIAPDVSQWNLGGNLETAVYLAQLSDKLAAIGRLKDARAALDRARDLAPNEPDVQLAVARFAVRFEKWGDVLKAARAARRHGAPVGATGILEGKALLETGDLSGARNALEGVARAEPSNTQALLMLATVCRAQRDFISEAEVMEALVREARRQGMPEAGFLAYTGQAWAQAGQAIKAAASYREALATGGLNEEQTAVVEESLAIIESRSAEARAAADPFKKSNSHLDAKSRDN